MRITAIEAVTALPEKHSDQVRRRLTDEHELDVFLVKDPLSRVLALEIRLLPRGIRLPEVQVGDVLEVEFFEEEGVLRIGLLSLDYSDVFYVLVDDLVEVLILNPGKQLGGRAVMSRLNRWERLLEASTHGLSLAAQKGLFGELGVLLHLANAIGIDLALDAWKGPEGGVRDFDLGGTAIEVKTTSARGLLTVRISSERQLEDDVVGRLFLWCVAIEKNENGRTINEMIGMIIDVIGTDETLRTRFLQKLIGVGYIPTDAGIYTTRFAIREDLVYRVWDGFPRIVPADVPDCVYDVSYSIDLEACSQWKCHPSTVWEDSRHDAD